MRILVSGGAGYIGCHFVREAAEQGHQILVVDDLSHGHRAAVDHRAELVVGNIGDYDLMVDVLKRHQIQTVIHFAANVEIEDSLINPDIYYHNNVGNTINLLRAMKDAQVKSLIFSSTAAVYGNATTIPILETETRNPINPYGRSKMISEMIISDFAKAYGLGYTILRYFNAAGAHPHGDLGEDHSPETHVIPRILTAAITNQNVQIFGTDYPTPDGTCVRDFIHVMDLAKAHLLALEITKPQTENVFNLGNDVGFSIREIILACERVTGKKLRVIESARRPGDPAILVANSDKARQQLKWTPKYTSIDSIIEHAWKWHSKYNTGYKEYVSTI